MKKQQSYRWTSPRKNANFPGIWLWFPASCHGVLLNLLSTTVEVLHMSCTFKVAAFLKKNYLHLRLWYISRHKALIQLPGFSFQGPFLSAPTSEMPCNLLQLNAGKGQEGLIKTTNASATQRNSRQQKWNEIEYISWH